MSQEVNSFKKQYFFLNEGSHVHVDKIVYHSEAQYLPL